MTGGFCGTLLALLLATGTLHAQAGSAGSTCVVSILVNGAEVAAAGNLKKGQCFGPGMEVVSPPGSVVKVITPSKSTITISGTLKIEEQSSKGESYWLRSGKALFDVVANKLSFFNVQGQRGHHQFQAAVKGTAFDMGVEEDKLVTLTPHQGTIRVSRAVKLVIKDADRAEAKRAVEAASRAKGRHEKALGAPEPNRSAPLDGSYSEKSELVTAGRAPLRYALDEDETLSFDTVEACAGHFTEQIAIHRRRVPDETDPDISEGYANLGDCRLEGDDPKKAIASYEKALAIDLRLYADGVHPDIAEDYRSLAAAHALGDPPDVRQAMAHARRALAIDRRLYPDGLDPDIADDHRTLAALHLLQDEVDQAIAELKLALAIDRQLYPDGLDYDLAEDNRSLGEAYVLAAIARRDRADHANTAIKYFEAALAIDRKLSGDDADPDLARDHRGLGSAYLVRNDPDRALASYLQACKIGLQLLGVGFSSDYDRIDIGRLDLDAVDVDIVEDLYEDVMTMSEIARERGRESEADKLERLADRIAAQLDAGLSVTVDPAARRG